MCDTLSLFPVTMRDMQFGGATNASFLFGFGNNLEYHILPKPQPDIQRSLLHYLDGGVAGHFPSIPLLEVPIILDPPGHPLNTNGVRSTRVAYGKRVYSMFSDLGQKSSARRTSTRTVWSSDSCRQESCCDCINSPSPWMLHCLQQSKHMTRCHSLGRRHA
jgi:hypothetical protein